jgi:hypothetical protein
MTKLSVLILFFVWWCLPVAGYSSNGPERVVMALRTQEPIKVDGVLGEKVWQGTGSDGFI